MKHKIINYLSRHGVEIDHLNDDQKSLLEKAVQRHLSLNPVFMLSLLFAVFSLAASIYVIPKYIDSYYNDSISVYTQGGEGEEKIVNISKEMLDNLKKLIYSLGIFAGSFFMCAVMLTYVVAEAKARDKIVSGELLKYAKAAQHIRQ